MWFWNVENWNERKMNDDSKSGLRSGFDSTANGSVRSSNAGKKQRTIVLEVGQTKKPIQVGSSGDGFIQNDY